MLTMAHDVFISYSTQDKSIADAVCAKLESKKMRCWIAPRDVPPGQAYAAALVAAINASRVVVLILSAGSNQSVHVLREIGEAVENGIPIIPLRIEDVEPTSEMRYYIKSLHWLDAMTPPIERHLDRLASTVQALLDVGEEAPEKPITAEIPPPPPKTRQKLPRWAIALIVVSIVAILCGGGGFAVWKMIPTSFWQDPTRTPRPTKQPDPTETDLPEETAPTEAVAVAEPTATLPPVDEEGWTTLEFMIPNAQLWEATEDGRYTAVDQNNDDAFAWSAAIFEGDLSLSFDLEGPSNQTEGCIIIYGSGYWHSEGSLLFCISSEWYVLNKHSAYHDGEYFLTYAESNLNFSANSYSVTVEIIGDTAALYVDGIKVLATFFDLDEISRQGRIGLYKFWERPEVTFSNLRVKTPEEGEQAAIDTSEGEWDCTVESSGEIDYIPITSPFTSAAVQIDGVFSSEEEWADAVCADLRSHYGINVTNPYYHRIRWWIQNNSTDLFFLARVPKNLAVRGVFVNYFWPFYTGTWEHSDGVFLRLSGEPSDWGLWDESNWNSDEDMDPPGTVDVEVAIGEDEEYYWFEFRRPLNSGDPNDWALEPGQTIGNNPDDSFMVGIVLEEGDFLRYLQLTLGEP